MAVRDENIELMQIFQQLDRVYRSKVSSVQNALAQHLSITEYELMDYYSYETTYRVCALFSTHLLENHLTVPAREKIPFADEIEAIFYDVVANIGDRDLMRRSAARLKEISDYGINAALKAYK